MSAASIDIPVLLDRLCHRHPSQLVDAIAEHEPGRRMVAHKNVTINEDFFQGHFPGVPLMPGVLMLETLTQVSALLLVEAEGPAPGSRVFLHGIDAAKFRRQVVPGDRLRLEVTLKRVRTRLARARAVAYVDEQVVAEALAASRSSDVPFPAALKAAADRGSALPSGVPDGIDDPGRYLGSAEWIRTQLLGESDE